MSDTVDFEDDDIELSGEETPVASSLLEDLTEEEVTTLANELAYEIDQCIADRGEKPENWEKWRDNREGVPDAQRVGRFEGSSQVVTPITEIICNNAFGKLKSAFDRDDAFFVYKPISEAIEAEVKRCKVITKYVKILTDSKQDLNWEKHKTVCLYEGGSMGTIFLDVNWITDRKKFKQKVAGEYQDVFQELSGVRLSTISVDDVYFRSSATDVQSSHFFAKAQRYQNYQLRNMANMGYFRQEDVDKVIKGATADSSDRKTAEAQRTGEGESDQEITTLFVCYYRYDADKDGYDEDLIFVYDKLSNTILDVKYNEFSARTIEPIVYMFRLDKIEGRGIAEMVLHMQSEANFHHRLRMDASQFEGIPMLVGKIGSGLKSKETIYPGKIFMTVNGAPDLQRLQGGNTYAGSMMAENQAVNYAQKVTAMSDTAGGFADQTMKSRDSFKGQMLRLDQSSGISGSIYDNTEASFDNVGLYILYYLIRNREAVIAGEKQYQRMSDADIAELDAALNVPFSSIPMKLYCTCHVANADETIEVMKQNYMMLYQMLASFYKEIIPAYMMVYGQQGQMMDEESKAAILKGISGSTKFMEKLMRLYGEEETFKYLPNTKIADVMLEMKALMDEQKLAMSGMRSGSMQGMPVQAPQQSQGQGMIESGMEQNAAAMPGGGAY